MPPWYFLTFEGCYETFTEPPTQDDPWIYKSYTGAMNIWYTLPSSGWFSLHKGIIYQGLVEVQEGGTPPSPLCGYAGIEVITLPRLEKPAWLVSLLDSLNWDILTWQVYLGDPIERGIDWVLDRINAFLGVIESALNLIAPIVSSISDLWSSITNYIDREVDDLWRQVRNLPSIIDDWWDGQEWQVLGWIDDARSWLVDQISVVEGLLQWLTNEWDNFRDYTLPGLLPSWDIQALINSAFAEWGDLFNWWGEFRENVMTFFMWPFDWMLERFTDWFLGEEE